MNIYTTTIAISILVYIVIGNYAGRGIKNLDDYYVAGRRAPTLLIVGTLVASLVSATMFLGEAGFAYDIAAGPYTIFPQSAAIGYVLGAFFFGRYLRRSRTTTVAEFFGRRFNSKRVQALAGFTIIFALGGYLLAVTQGAGILLSEITDLNYTACLFVAWLSYTAFTMYSGSRGVILTDTIMFLLFAFASVAAVSFVVSDLGGLPGIVEQLTRVEEKPGLASWHGAVGPGRDFVTPMDYLIWAIVIDVSWALVYMVSPWQSSRHLMAKNEHVVLRAATIAAVVVALMQVMVYGMGGIINLGAADIDPPDSAMIWASLNMLPGVLGALMLAGITAAALSSGSTFLSLVGFSVSNDIGIVDTSDHAATLRFSRIMMLAAGAVVLGLALVFPPQIFWLTTFIATVFASSWGPVGIMSIWSRRITEAAAFWGMLTGLVFNVVPKFFVFIGAISLPSYLDPAIIGFVASLVVTMVVSRRTIVTVEEADYLDALHDRPADEVERSKVRNTLIASIVLMIVNGMLAPWFLLEQYLKPYQAATGQLLDDGSLNVWTGEFAAIAAWVVTWFGLGLFSIWYIRRSYSPPAAGQPQ
jgi:sodium/pantothenate symporter